MLEFNKEYYNNNCYFLIKEGKNKIIVFYTVGDTLTESRKNDSRMDFDKKHEKEVKENISKFLKQKKKLSKDYITKKFEKIKGGELDELVDSDATWLGSNVPILNQRQSPINPIDLTVSMACVPTDPRAKGNRLVYWSLNEVDYSEAFGYEETKDLDYDETVETLEGMGVENADERADELGKLPGQKVKKNRKGQRVLKQRLSEKEKIEEEKKQMLKMVEDILTKKNKDKSDIIEKENNKPINSFIKKNIESLKKIAKKEGLSINDIIKALKNDE